MKRMFVIILTVFSLSSVLILPVYANNKSPIYPDKLNEGTYSISVDSSSSMFKIIDCQLTVANGKMTADITLSGKGYEKLFMGTSAEAQSADDSNCIYFKENADEKYTYTAPIEALDTEIDCAAFSKKKQKWYDRKLIFKSDSLPDDAFQKSSGSSLIVIFVAIICLVGSISFIIKNHPSTVKNKF